MTQHKKLSIYFTAGIPQLEDTTEIAKELQNAGADLMEIGIPYSDPVADGPIIQKAHELALKNGMTINILFDQLNQIKDEVQIPKILMGYFNPIFHYGFETFCQKCQECGVTGLIIPDLPPIEFETTYRTILEKYHLNFSFLVTPETPVERIHYLDALSSGFIYAVSSSSTTGQKDLGKTNSEYLNQFKSLNLRNPVMIGFGISTKKDFAEMTSNVDGGIIGSAFVKILLENTDYKEKIKNYIHSIVN